MTFVEQHQHVERLKAYQQKMDRREREDFEMMIKRDKDDEQFDTLTQRRLEALHAKYVPRRSKSDLDAMWKKMAGNNGPEGNEQ